MSKPRIAITMGDPSGIGPEIVARAVSHPAVLASCEPIVVADPVAFALHRLSLPSVEILPVPGLNKRLKLGEPSGAAGQAALECLEKGVSLIESRQVAALVTAPISKQSLEMAQARVPGHTEWLADRTKSESPAMLMVAGKLRALLMTRHEPLKNVSRSLTEKVITRAARLAHRFVCEQLRRRRPRLVLCGLNPHAGDNGILGREELTVMRPALEKLKKEKISIDGPLAADSAFRDMVQGHYDLALAAYHDQGMIPLKVYAPDKLVNITLGLPFIRTSPGHGTAFDIAGARIANVKPTIEAIRLAVEYSQ